MKARGPINVRHGLLLLGLLVLSLSIPTGAQPTTYSGVTFPLGDLAFADRVVEYVPGSCVTPDCDDPEKALGPPSVSGCSTCSGCDGCGADSVALGFRVSPVDDRAYLMTEFVDNALSDVDGDDLFIFFSREVPALVEISADGNSWIPLGTSTGCPAAYDIGPYVQPGDSFRYVKISDVPADEGRADCPGPCIDAIAAMGTVEFVTEASGELSIQPTGRLLFTFTDQYDEDILFLMDTTGSMRRYIDDEQKIDIAKNAVIGLLDILPEGVRVGFRTFAGCGKSNLISPLDTPIDIPTLQSEIRSIIPGGTTPLAYVLGLAIEDCDCISRPKTLILVSDGIETCGGDPIQAARELAASDDEITAYVIGFDVGGTLAARDQLIEIADVLGGEYLDAKDSEGLMLALSYAVPLSYAVIDAEGEIVYEGRRGDAGPGQLPAGVYTIRIDGMPPLVLEDVEISGDGTTSVSITIVDGELRAEVVNEP